MWSSELGGERPHLLKLFCLLNNKKNYAISFFHIDLSLQVKYLRTKSMRDCLSKEDN